MTSGCGGGTRAAQPPVEGAPTTSTAPTPTSGPTPDGSDPAGSTAPRASATTSAPRGPTSTRPPIATPPVDGIPPVSAAPATALVDGLRVAPPDPAAGDYRRDAFGSGWSYDGRSGCNTRELVLAIESHPAAVVGPRCKPLSGHWTSIYDGVAATDPAALEIDHLVPLADAWRSGAAHWTDGRRVAFANDLTDPDTLVAVTSRSNRSKGDSSPDQWLPPALQDRCRYVEAWIRVKARWSLAVTPAEKATLVQVISGC